MLPAECFDPGGKLPSLVLRESFSAERGELTALVARVLGFDRTGNGLESSISDEIDWILKVGTISESGGRMEAKQSQSQLAEGSDPR